ncbi:hypothetical protein D915_010008 [Fasciola hepatica]|uniref:Uncharacterized protein n=1 Tax=Fasciola hepatica TaxID=6192 RepID=A0A4E0R7T8_FASHE|nr:hypothetical protein D915_010008 [Fasciola hepatica]
MYDRERDQRRRFGSGRQGGFRRGFGNRQGFRRDGPQDDRQSYRDNDRSFVNRPYERNGRPRPLDSRPRPSLEEFRPRNDRPPVRSGFSNESNIQRKRPHSPTGYNRTNYDAKVMRTNADAITRNGRPFVPDSGAHRSRMENRYPSYGGNNSTNRDYQLSRPNRSVTNHASVNRDRHSPKAGRPVNSGNSNRRGYDKNDRPRHQSGSDLSLPQRDYRPSRSSERYSASNTSKSVYTPNRTPFRNSEANRWK